MFLVKKHKNISVNRDDIEQFYQIVTQKENDLQRQMDKLLNITLHRTCTRIRDSDKEHVPIFALHFKHVSHTYVTLVLNECNVLCDHVYNQLINMSHNNVVRLSFGFYNTEIEIKYIASILKEFDSYTTKSLSYARLFINLISTPSHVSMHMFTIYKEREFKNSFEQMQRDTLHTLDFNVFRLYSIVYIPLLAKIGNARYLPSDKRNTPHNISKESDLCHYQHSNVVLFKLTKAIITQFATNIYEHLKRYINYVHLHQIRLDLSNSRYHDVLGDFFQSAKFDETHTYIGLMCVNRENICGGQIDIINKKTLSIETTYVLAHGQLITLDMTQSTFMFTDIEKVSYVATDSYIDIIILLSVF